MADLSEEQELCVLKIIEWYNDSKAQVFRVDGLAGTGKTFLVKYAVERLQLGCVLYAAFTGKAALVLERRGCSPANTIHKLIYHPAGSGDKKQLEKKEAELFKLESALDEGQSATPEILKLRKEVKQLLASAQSPSFKLNLESDVKYADLVIIDECSMVGEDLAKDLLSFDTKILVLGDPGQLPPVFGEGYFMKKPADFTLTKIHRQAEGSPILKMATVARMGGRLQPMEYGQGCRIIERKDLTAGIALDADQILCGRNKTRHINNAQIRKLKGFSGEIPQTGEKLICLRNNHEKGLLNGSLWIVERANKFSKYRISLTVVPEEGGAPLTMFAHSQYFRMYGHTDEDKWWEQLANEEKSIGFDVREAENFTYGYVITVHKSQGSQWDKVLLLDEAHSFGPDAKKHRYTGITRAVSQLTVVNM